jgi:succinate dehydrogenase/fumarate reductase flavoprotein subunit
VSETVAGGPVTPEEFVRDMSAPPPGADGTDGPAGGPPGAEGGAPGGGVAGATMGGASAGMAIHTSEGLVPLDETGQTDIPGLNAAGDALGSCMSGGTFAQIGSSLAGSAVQGAIAGAAAATEAAGLADPAIADARPLPRSSKRCWHR